MGAVDGAARGGADGAVRGGADGAARGGGQVMLRDLDCQDASSSFRDGGDGSSKIFGYWWGILWVCAPLANVIVSSEIGWFFEVLVFPSTRPVNQCCE